MIVSPCKYQKEATDNALSIFRYALKQIELAPDEVNRRQAAAYNGCVLIQAPTGSGKTLMAGLIAEEFAREAKVVWFWFTPFAGLVDQASIALKKQFAGLRVRDIQSDRLAMGTKSGDVFVSTWAAVAANNEKARRLRRDGDLSLALDTLVPSLREAGYHIGVVVDEAHHTFSGATEAVRFYTEVMQPEFTLLITATPDDKDFSLASPRGCPITRSDGCKLIDHIAGAGGLICYIWILCCHLALPYAGVLKSVEMSP